MDCEKALLPIRFRFIAIQSFSVERNIAIVIENTCCVTGHRSIPSNQIDEVRLRLQNEISSAVAQGFTRFISGYAQGVDLLFAELVFLMMEEMPQIQLEAALPYRERFTRLLFDPKTKALLLAADKVHISCEEYSLAAFHIRNRYMVAQSARIIAVHDGRQTGGTAATLRYAHSKERDVREILIPPTAEKAGKP